MQMCSLQTRNLLRSYNTAKALPKNKNVRLINKRKFVKVALEKDFKIFIMQITALKATPTRMTIYFFQIALITSDDLVQVVAL